MTGDERRAALQLPEELVGERIVLRPYRLADAPAVFEAVDQSRARLRLWMEWVDGHAALADSEDYCRRVSANWENRSDFSLGIWHRETGRFLGGTGFHNTDWSVPSFEIGYWIRDGEVGKGYVEEAVRLQVRFAFDVLGAERLMLDLRPRERPQPPHPRGDRLRAGRAAAQRPAPLRRQTPRHPRLLAHSG